MAVNYVCCRLRADIPARTYGRKAITFEANPKLTFIVVDQYPRRDSQRRLCWKSKGK